MFIKCLLLILSCYYLLSDSLSFFLYIAAGTVSDISAPHDSVVSWSPPNPSQGIILYYNIRITLSGTQELVRLILEFKSTSIDVSSEVTSDGTYKVQVCLKSFSH